VMSAQIRFASFLMVLSTARRVLVGARVGPLRVDGVAPSVIHKRLACSSSQKGECGRVLCALSPLRRRTRRISEHGCASVTVVSHASRATLCVSSSLR